MANRYLHELNPWPGPLLPPSALLLIEEAGQRLEYRINVQQLIATLGAGAPFAIDATIALGGYPIGYYKGTTQQHLQRLLSPSLYPTYQPAQLQLTQSAPEVGPVGELLENTLTSNFLQNDAGQILSNEIRKGSAVVLGTPTTASYAQATTTVRRTLTPITFQAHAAHEAGLVKQVEPDGTDDTRPAQVGQPNAPQAANPDLLSNEVVFVGQYEVLYGPAPAAPTTTTQARALAGYQLTGAGNSITLETGTTERFFALFLPPGRTLLKVNDRETNADLLSQYKPRPFSFADAGGNPQPYTLYLMEQAVAYTSNHHHDITTSA